MWKTSFGSAFALIAIVAGIWAATGNAGHAAKVTKVRVVAKEFKFTLSRKTVPTGIVAFTVVNKGKIAHDFRIAGKKTRTLKPGQSATLRVNMKKKGRFAYKCTLPGHAAAGMKGVLKVTAGRAAAASSRVTVVAREFSFTLSKRVVPVGTVAFTVVNRGKIAHDFKIAGKKTPLLAPGKRATITVRLGKNGTYSYVCTVTGHAAAGMRGVLTVGRPAPATTTTVAPPPTQTATVGSAKTTVQVGMFEYRFELSQSTIPSGQVTFVITNKGQEPHNFDISGVKAGAIIGPGETETWTVALPARGYGYECDVPFHADRGMVGDLTVTP